MMVLAIWIEYPFDVAVQRSHDADPCEHRRAAKIGDKYERFDSGLPFRERGLFLRKASNVCRGVPQRTQHSAVGEGDGVVEFA
jgi:hypothetical protein